MSTMFTLYSKNEPGHKTRLRITERFNLAPYLFTTHSVAVLNQGSEISAVLVILDRTVLSVHGDATAVSLLQQWFLMHTKTPIR